VCVVVGTLIPDNPGTQKIFMWKLHRIESGQGWDYQLVIQLFENTLKDLYGEESWVSHKDKVKMFVTDSGSQLVKAGRILVNERGYEDHMVYLQCLIHKIHNVCEKIH